MPAKPSEGLREKLEAIEKKYPSAKLESTIDGTLTLVTDTKVFKEIAERLHQDPEFRFDHLSCISAVDYLDFFTVVYHMFSRKHRWGMVLKATVSRDKPEIASVVSIWATADWQEREQYEMYGIKFEGHPNLRPLLLTDDFPGYPMRKDFPNENLEEYLLEDTRPDYIPIPGVEE